MRSPVGLDTIINIRWMLIIILGCAMLVGRAEDGVPHSPAGSSEDQHSHGFVGNRFVASSAGKNPSTQPTGAGKLLLRCVSPLGCRVSIDGEPFATIPPNAARKAALDFGEHLIETDSDTPALGAIASHSTVVNSSQQRLYEIAPRPPTWAQVATAVEGRAVLAHTKAGARGFDRDKKEWTGIGASHEINGISDVCSGFLNRFVLADVEKVGSMFILPELLDVSSSGGKPIEIKPRDCSKQVKQNLHHHGLEQAESEGWLTVRTQSLTGMHDKNGESVLVGQSTSAYPSDIFSLVASDVRVRGGRALRPGKLDDCPRGENLAPFFIGEVLGYLLTANVGLYVDTEKLEEFDSTVRVLWCR
ncbi:hypothetical protein W02_25060 [Nitrospira sp. KM1]|uniref:hypothetical protein n=1 Tax=Nitrospira sp. KM1 TaxID=1936990 RepID=UPI0013A73E5D|nr:hypothetical protein [Nitrospira sp. KM1]BCA55366.1 hypothetical protein W02_25060 [Nitrospira sp. KM1]